LVQASLVSSTQVLNLTALAWTDNTAPVMARNILGATYYPAAAALSVQ
jgi:hypothetical protein